MEHTVHRSAGSHVERGHRRPGRSITAAALLALFALLAGCSDDSASTTTFVEDPTADVDETTEDTGTEDTGTDDADTGATLTILVSNDDGVDAPGISALVEALRALPDTTVVVSAPAENQSGTGSSVSEGELIATETTTAAGYEATAVAGTPADSVNWALDGGIDVTPDLVITGINAGQNLGAVGDEISGTVGAARAAAARGIPALATSAAHADGVDYDAAAAYVVEWVQEHRSALLSGEMGGEVLLQSMNIPVCAVGEVRGVAEVEVAETGEGAFSVEPQDCSADIDQPADDITAFNNGWVTLADLPLVGAQPGS